MHWVRGVGAFVTLCCIAACGGSTGSGSSSGGSGGVAGNGGSGGAAGHSGSGGAAGNGASGADGSGGSAGGCVSQIGGSCGGNIANPCMCAAGLVCKLNKIPDTGGKCESP
jgi:hypothetical protein